MRNDRCYIIILVLSLLPMFASCRKDLCYNHYPAINVSFRWEQEWERDYGMSYPAIWDDAHFGFAYDDLRPSLPEWVALVKYTENEAPDERFLSPTGGQLVLGEHTRYSYLFYNGDTEYIVLSDMASLPDARASATSRSRASIASVIARHPDARTTNPPDNLYSAFIDDGIIVENHELRPMSVKMQPLVYTYVVRYIFEHGQEHISQARGALGGMAESVYLRDGSTSDEATIILYDCSVKPYGCEARVRSFGIPGFPDEYYGRKDLRQPEPRPYTLNLEVLLRNGKVLEFNYDISDQMEKQPRGGVIEISGLRVEDDQTGFDSGFSVDVTDWGEKEEQELPFVPYKD